MMRCTNLVYQAIDHAGILKMSVNRGFEEIGSTPEEFVLENKISRTQILIYTHIDRMYRVSCITIVFSFIGKLLSNVQRIQHVQFKPIMAFMTRIHIQVHTRQIQ